ncbi:MAG: NAD+ synthase, partial [Chloroflexi bacterium]|nr:NAD+ synthase [Chloroflexota bacterium]
MRTFRLAMAQINATVGDLDGNAERIIASIREAGSLGADLVAFPELALPGYPPEDLLLKPQFIRENQERLRHIAAECADIAAVVGFIDSDSDIYNAAAVIHNREIVGVYHKMYLPNYGVFDEDRYFAAGGNCPVFTINGTPIGVNICEDIWYATGPAVVQRAAGAEIIVNINGSPFHAGKRAFREKMLATRAADNGLFVAYVNLVGGQDELVFDGNSVVFTPDGEILAEAAQFEEQLLVADLDVEAVFRSSLRDPRTRKERGADLTHIGKPVKIHVSDYTKKTPSSSMREGWDGGENPVHPESVQAHQLVRPESVEGRDVYDETAEVYAALTLGTRDYVRKCGFSKVLIALSGGIDSTLVAAVAADALGSENVVGIAMPSRYSSEGSVLDAMALADNLGIEIWTLPIEDAFSAYLDTLAPRFAGTESGVAEENMQSRIRGNLIMAVSNKFNWLVLTTGNKSEMATGYATIYGDMAGGYAVIKDVPKQLVYALCRYRNTLGEKPVIPQSVIDKPPSAELRPDQKDEDSLPPYSVLDPILKAYVEDDYAFDDIVAMGYEPDT